MRRHLYPSDWREISLRIRERATGRCECVGQCGLHHERRCEERHGELAKWARGRVVLTAAHLNHIPADCRDENLRAMCQRCHLRYDQRMHQVHARETRDRKRGQIGLPI